VPVTRTRRCHSNVMAPAYVRINHNKNDTHTHTHMHTRNSNLVQEPSAPCLQLSANSFVLSTFFFLNRISSVWGWSQDPKPGKSDERLALQRDFSTYI